MKRLVNAVAKSMMVMSLAAPIASLRAATDYYLSTTGNDANSGLTREAAKATLAGAAACLKDDGDRVIVTAGVYTNESASTILLTNGWSIVGESGAAQTRIVVKTVVCQFNLASDDTAVRGLTVDFNKVDFKGAGAGFASSPRGTIADCEIRNFSCTTANANMTCPPISMTEKLTPVPAPVISNCTFRACTTAYRMGSAIYVTRGHPLIVGCQFIDCTAGSSYFNYGTIRLGDSNVTSTKGIVRNCLFLRCTCYDPGGDTRGKSAIINFGEGGASAQNCTLIDCEITGAGTGGMIGDRGTAYNCLAINCRNSHGPIGFLSGVTCDHCAAQVETPKGTDNKILAEGDFEFACVREGRYNLVAGVPIDAGKELSWMSGAVDLAGNSRIINGKPDIGCYEFVSAPKTYYVAPDGDDANDGLTRTMACATLAGAASKLSGFDERVLVTDGFYTNLTASTVVLSNGWRVVGENGPDKAHYVIRSVAPVFALKSPGATVQGLTVNFTRLNFRDVSGSGALSSNPQGVFRNCRILNYYTSWDKNIVYMDNASVQPQFLGCVFKNAQTGYRASVFEVLRGQPVVDGCSFIDCDAGTKASTKYYAAAILRMGDANKTANTGYLRNCLFLRCSVWDTGSDSTGDSHILRLGTRLAKATNCSVIDSYIAGKGTGAAIGRAGTAVNCLVYGCTNSTGLATISSGTTCDHCAAETELAGDGNVPLAKGSLRFLKPRKDNYTVISGPTLDAGKNEDWMTDAVDVLGNPRIVNEVVDIGCYEYGYDYTPPGLLMLLR